MNFKFGHPTLLTTFQPYMIMLVLIHHSSDCICEVPPPLLNQGFFGFSEGKESTFSAGNLGLIPGSGRWRTEWLPTPVFLPGEFYGQRSLGGYSLWGHKESDTTGLLTLWLSLHAWFEFSHLSLKREWYN